MKIYDVIIIGAGPSGIFTGVNCANGNNRILILEKNPSPGKKLLLSGAGQCNITHKGNMKEFLDYYGENSRFLKHALYNFTNKDLINFFEEKGLKFISNENGKIFPETMRAKDVLDILINKCKEENVEIKYNSPTEEIYYCREEGLFNIKANKDKYRTRKLVIATGGQSYSVTGSSGDGYIFAEKLGHEIQAPLPALTPLDVEDYPFAHLSGIAFPNVPISLWRDNKKIRETTGDLLLTHKNISGPGILNFSRYVVPGDVIKINFIGKKDIEGFRREFIENIQLNGKNLVKTLLKEYPIPKRFSDRLLEILHIDEETNCAQFKKKQRNKLIEYLTAFPMKVKRLGGFHIAMATRGGVDLSEVNPKTMGSKVIDGLYFVGEVLDIDGDTGGYNLQAAFSTAYIAGQDIRKFS